MENNEKHLPSYILRSKYRKDVLFMIIEHPFQTQTDLLKQTSPKYRSHISRTIRELIGAGLIVCENPKEKTYKMYKPTEKAMTVKEEIEKYGKS